VRYTVALKPAAQRELYRLRGIAFIAVRGVILALADEPRPPGSSKLARRQALWRVRVRIDGKQWRIVYQIDDRQRMIVVARVTRRNEGTYKGI
jgi:mRNA interferase RelE/StbE